MNIDKKMKKLLLLSIAASAVLVAGGDIEQVDAPIVISESNWDFKGNVGSIYQTTDVYGLSEMGAGNSTAGTLGLQISAENKDIIWGFGAGAELTATYSNENFSELTMVDADGHGDRAAAALTRAYLSYGIGNTSVKVGRQNLPKALSPFAYTEDWNLVGNTFEAALIVNTDLPDTLIAGAYVSGANNYADLSEFNDINEDGVYMLAAMNKSVPNLTLTGTYYYAGDLNPNGDLNILWGNASYDTDSFAVAGQGGYIFGDAVDSVETAAFGIKGSAKFSGVEATLAFTSVDDGAVPVINLGTGQRSALYTQMAANTAFIVSNSDTFMGKLGYGIGQGEIGAAYGYSTIDTGTNVDVEASEFDIYYTANGIYGMDITAEYAYQDVDADFGSVTVSPDGNNLVRVKARYNF